MSLCCGAAAEVRSGVGSLQHACNGSTLQPASIAATHLYLCCVWLLCVCRARVSRVWLVLLLLCAHCPQIALCNGTLESVHTTDLLAASCVLRASYSPGHTELGPSVVLPNQSQPTGQINNRSLFTASTAAVGFFSTRLLTAATPSFCCRSLVPHAAAIDR